MLGRSPQDAGTPSTRPGFLSRLRQRLNRGDSWLTRDLGELVGGRRIDAAILEELEARLLTADVGVEATARILGELRPRLARNELADAAALTRALREIVTAILAPCARPLLIDRTHKPFVVLVVGVNGSGKTTTIGKLARRCAAEGASVLLAAGDTFRAAAIEQLKVWAERAGAEFAAQLPGADPGAVVFDALEAARARGCDVVLADTAGRLHSQPHLMEELKKVRRVIGKLDDSAPHEVLLVLDAGTGQNAINQAKQFNQTVNLTGLALTKLDGTAKGGVIFALAKQFGLPIRYIGVGEGIDDLRTFEAEPFVQALFQQREQ